MYDSDLTAPAGMTAAATMWTLNLSTMIVAIVVLTVCAIVAVRFWPERTSG